MVMKFWKYYMFVIGVYATYIAWSVSNNEQNEMWMRAAGMIFGFVNPMIAIDSLIAGIKIQWQCKDQKDIR
jgi:hypothetical protein